MTAALLIYQLVHAGAGARVDSVQVPTVFVSYSNTMYPGHGQSAIYFLNIGSNNMPLTIIIEPTNRANTFI